MNEITRESGKSTRLEIYDFIVNKKGEAYVKDSKGNMAYLIGETTLRGTKYVRTRPDSVTSDNLLSLSECP
jgi:hypothetical protein